MILLRFRSVLRFQFEAVGSANSVGPAAVVTTVAFVVGRFAFNVVARFVFARAFFLGRFVGRQWTRGGCCAVGGKRRLVRRRHRSQLLETQIAPGGSG